jgi:2-polyprenyl-6-methoxyphenol hydroxylase-like FAD-dependent oxidoreductase
VVVGADGWNSRVARAVGAECYHAKPLLQVAYYTYWSGLPLDGFTTLIRGDRGFAALPTHDDLTLVLTGCPTAAVETFKRDIEGNYLAAFDAAPEFAARLRAATPVHRVVGGGVPNFFRTVGD